MPTKKKRMKFKEFGFHPNGAGPCVFKGVRCRHKITFVDTEAKDEENNELHVHVCTIFCNKEGADAFIKDEDGVQTKYLKSLEAVEETVEATPEEEVVEDVVQEPTEEMQVPEEEVVEETKEETPKK